MRFKFEIVRLFATIRIGIVSVALHDKHPLQLPLMVAHWPTSDEAALIDFLVEHKAEAGNGFSFKGATWQAAAVHMAAYTVRGDPKTDRVCKNKWARVRAGDFLPLCADHNI